MTPAFVAAVPGGTIAAWQQGQGPHVLLLHGGPGMSEYTDSLAAELEDGYTVTRYQQRGLLPSTSDGPFDVETHVADAIAVMDSAGISQAYLVGHSWGGHLALHLALAHQERFFAVAPVDPLGAVGDGGLAEMGATMEEPSAPNRAPRPLSATPARCHRPALRRMQWKPSTSCGPGTSPLLPRSSLLRLPGSRCAATKTLSTRFSDTSRPKPLSAV